MSGLPREDAESPKTPLPGLPTGAIELIRPHLKKTTGLIMANVGECLEIRRREVGTIRGRTFEGIVPTELGSLRLPKHWILAAVMCPRDGTDELAEFANGLDTADLSRIRFYWHSGCRPAQALRAWHDTGLGPIQDNEIDGWGRFHKLFGSHHSIQVYNDHVKPGRRGIPSA